jgi:hypothetical protein
MRERSLRGDCRRSTSAACFVADQRQAPWSGAHITPNRSMSQSCLASLRICPVVTRAPAGGYLYIYGGLVRATWVRWLVGQAACARP